LQSQTSLWAAKYYKIGTPEYRSRINMVSG